MDEIVAAALRKWPHVPHCHGWLALDARGDWYMRDERVQAAGAFPAVKGSRIEHAALLAFIGRNYAADASGAWYFQNGPQRVYVELEAAPWVWRLGAPTSGAAPRLESHTGLAAHFDSGWLDEHGRVFVATEHGAGIVHSLDMEAAADAVEAGAWRLTGIAFAELPRRFGYRLRPAQPAGR